MTDRAIACSRRPCEPLTHPHRRGMVLARPADTVRDLDDKGRAESRRPGFFLATSQGRREMIDSIPTATLLLKAGRHPLRAVRRLMETARLSRLTSAEERDVATRFLSDVFGVDASALVEACRRSG